LIFDRHLSTLWSKKGLFQYLRYSGIIALIALATGERRRFARSTSRRKMPLTLNLRHPRRGSPDD
jgi:hypothetical protein